MNIKDNAKIEKRYAASVAIYRRNGDVMIVTRSEQLYHPGKESMPSRYIWDENNNYVHDPVPEDDMKKHLIEKVKMKLNLDIELMDKIGEMDGIQTEDETKIHVTMVEFIGKIIGDEPDEIIPNKKYYSEARFYNINEILKMKPRGLCTKILKNKLEEDPDFWKEYF